MQAGRTAGVIAMAGSLLLAGGCLFTARTPEAPGTGGFTNTPPSSQIISLQNVQQAMVNKAVTNYIQTLEQTGFTLVPDPGDVADLGADVYANWNLTTEKTAMTQVLATQGIATFVWNHGQDLSTLTYKAAPDGVSTHTYYQALPYSLTFSKNGASVTASGTVDLYFQEDSNGFYIYKWQDYRDSSNNKTLGYYRVKGTIIY